MLRSGYKTDREKLDRISEIVNDLFSFSDGVLSYAHLILIDQICDVPLDGEF